MLCVSLPTRWDWWIFTTPSHECSFTAEAVRSLSFQHHVASLAGIFWSATQGFEDFPPEKKTWQDFENMPLSPSMMPQSPSMMPQSPCLMPQSPCLMPQSPSLQAPVRSFQVGVCQNLWLSMLVGFSHPFTSYFDVHQGYHGLDPWPGEEHLHWCGGFSERGHLGSRNLKAMQIDASATDVGHYQWGWRWDQQHPGWRSVLPTLCGKNTLLGSSDAFRCSDTTEMLGDRYLRLPQPVQGFQDVPFLSGDDKSERFTQSFNLKARSKESPRPTQDRHMFPSRLASWPFIPDNMMVFLPCPPTPSEAQKDVEKVSDLLTCGFIDLFLSPRNRKSPRIAWELWLLGFSLPFFGLTLHQATPPSAKRRRSWPAILMPRAVPTASPGTWMPENLIPGAKKVEDFSFSH